MERPNVPAAVDHPPRTVFFDAGGTILQVKGSVGEVYAAAAARRGHPVEPAAVNGAFRAAWGRSLLRRREAGYRSNDEVLRAEWRLIVAECFRDLIPPAVAGDVFEELYDHFSGPDPWVVAPGAVRTFEALRAAGLRLGLLSNWDSRLLICLERLDLRRWFDHLVISFEVGVEKPHPEIFRTAARRAGHSPSSLVHVGDSFELDIAPALALGWRALWLGGEPARAHGSGAIPVRTFADVRETVLRLVPADPAGRDRDG